MEDTSKPRPWWLPVPAPGEETPEERLARAREIWARQEEQDRHEDFLKYGARDAEQRAAREQFHQEARARYQERKKAYQAAEAQRAREQAAARAERDRQRRIAREIKAARAAAAARDQAKALARWVAEQAEKERERKERALAEAAEMARHQDLHWAKKIDQLDTAWRAKEAAKELKKQEDLYRQEIQAEAVKATEEGRQRRQKAARPRLNYLMIAEGQHQDNLLRIVGQQFNRLLEEVAPFEEGSSLQETLCSSSDYWDARFEMQREGQRDKRQYNRFRGIGPKWGVRQSVA